MGIPASQILAMQDGPAKRAMVALLPAKKKNNDKRRDGFDPKGITVRVVEQSSDRLRLTLPHPPTVNDSYQPVVHGRHASIALTKTGTQFKALVAYSLANRCTPIAGTVTVALRSVGSRTDIDGCLKITLDSLQGIAYVNDRLVHRLVVAKVPADSGPCPRLEVVVEALRATAAESGLV